MVISGIYENNGFQKPVLRLFSLKLPEISLKWGEFFDFKGIHAHGYIRNSHKSLI